MTEQHDISQTKWSVLKKVSFLLILTYTTLYIFGFFLDGIVLWVGKYILNDELKIVRSGSGDTAFNYMKVLTIAVLSVILAPLIFIIDRKRDHYNVMLYWFFVCLRYYVGFYLITYGFAKIFQSQFPFPHLSRLEQTYGSSSPMGLLWTFMGYSPAYNVFAGMGEVIGGVLLFFRRTTMLGCLIVIVVMSNVLMLNLCYDVPVKLFSSHLILFSIIVLAPNIKGLYNFFILNKRVSLFNYDLPIRSESLKGHMKTARIVLKSLVFLIIVINGIRHFQSMGRNTNRNQSPLYGIYNTETFIVNRDTLLPLKTDTNYWNKVIIDETYMRINTKEDKFLFYKLRLDTNSKTMSLSGLRDNKDTLIHNLTYTDSKKYLYLKGKWNNDSIHVKLHRKDINNYLLINRGFHWINEYPFNK